MEIDLPGNNSKESNITVNDTSMKEDSINKKKRRVVESPVINKVGSTPVTITLNELMKISPQLRTQYKKDLAAMRTEYEDVEDKVNVIDQEDDYSEEEKTPTAAYVNCSIDGKIFEVIVDTRAGVNIMSENTMHRLGYFIDELTKRTVITANGESVTL